MCGLFPVFCEIICINFNRTSSRIRHYGKICDIPLSVMSVSEKLSKLLDSSREFFDESDQSDGSPQRCEFIAVNLVCVLCVSNWFLMELINVACQWL